MNCYLTHKFTLVPTPYFKEEESREIIGELYNVSKNEEIRYISIANINAVLLYSVPKELNSSDINYYPLAYKMLEYLKEIPEYNKVIFHFSKEKEITHILISKGNSLQLLNSYNAKDFNSALYFLLLAIKQTIINSHQTILHILSNISKEENEIIQNYFKQIAIKEEEKI